MNIFELTITHITNYLLIFARISSLIFLAPLFGARNIPFSFKMGFSFLLSFIFLPLFGTNPIYLPNFVVFISMIVKEVFVGMVMGFACILVFATLQFAGHLIDMQMGLGIMNIIDPQSQAQVTVIGQFAYMIFFLLFIIADGHHLILKALFESFEIVPVSGSIYNPLLTKYFMSLGSKIFAVGLKLAIPAVGLVFLAELSMGVIARTVPQINIFLVGFPIRIALGLFVVGASIPVFLYVCKPLIFQTYKDMIVVVKLLGG